MSIERIEAAQRYFQPAVARFRLAADEPAPAPSPVKFTDSDGLFAFVFSEPALADRPDIAERVKQAAYYLKGFCTLVTHKLLSDNAANVSKAFDLPPASVMEVASHLPLVGTFVGSKTTNAQQTTNVEFSVAFLKAALDLVIGADAQAVVDTAKWLTSVGSQIKITHDVSKQTYNVTMFSAMIEVIGRGAVIDIEPKFRVSGTSLAVSDVETAITSCMQSRSFSLAFEAESFTAAVDIDSIQNAEIKAALDRLVTGNAVAQITSSSNYFGVSPSTSALLRQAV